jgi:5,10-methylenetetrahydromethanopterin reductase
VRVPIEFIHALLVRPPTFPHPPAELARRAEDTGWFGTFVSDSQNLSPETWLTVGQAIAGTTTLRIGVGVTNPSTRFASVTASAAAGAQFYSGGRLILGFGRGDSAVHKVGREPARLPDFERYLTTVLGYLRGEAAEADTDGTPTALWSAGLGLTPPPVDVSSTGPKVIDIAARLTDDISFSVGADPARVRRAVDQARTSRAGSERAGRPLSLGAYVMIVVTEDVAQGRTFARGLASIHHRFSAMNSSRPLDGLSAADAEAATRLSAAYRTAGHGVTASAQAQALDDDFLDRFTIIGPPGYCVERLQALVELGITRFWGLPGASDVDPAQSQLIYDRIAAQVIPSFT